HPNLALLKAEKIEMPKKWVLELLNTIEALQQENKQLQELAKAKEEGKLAILPLKVGSTIYRLEAPQYSWEIVSATIYLDETIFIDDSDNIIKETDIGKTVFLTREEAEKALREG
ncbi:MAG TPA: hypothetical protein PK684_09785, partial [Bacillota bacterium]|nr:hypothetical protein [Bacillota bacterium]